MQLFFSPIIMWETKLTQIPAQILCHMYPEVQVSPLPPGDAVVKDLVAQQMGIHAVWGFVSPGEALKASIPALPACLCLSGSRRVSWSHFICIHLQPASTGMREEAITGASNAKQMCNYENRGLHLVCSLPQRQSCYAQCNPQQPNPQTAN